MKGRVIKVDTENKDEKGQPRLELTLKKTVVREKHLFYNDIEIGMKLNARVKAITDFGVFVTIANSGAMGLCHISEVSDK